MEVNRAVVGYMINHLVGRESGEAFRFMLRILDKEPKVIKQIVQIHIPDLMDIFYQEFGQRLKVGNYDQLAERIVEQMKERYLQKDIPATHR